VRACLEALEAEVNAPPKFFLPEIAGWKRTNLEQNQRSASRYHRDAKDSNTATVSLTGGSGGAVRWRTLGGFAKLGVQSSGKQVKVAGLPPT
jgi:hypothetical protein